MEQTEARRTRRRLAFWRREGEDSTQQLLRLAALPALGLALALAAAWVHPLLGGALVAATVLGWLSWLLRLQRRRLAAEAESAAAAQALRDDPPGP